MLCGSKVLYQGRTTDSLSLVTDSLTGETSYYLLAWSDNTIPSGRRSALYDKDGNPCMEFERDYNAFQTGNLLVLSKRVTSSTTAAPQIQKAAVSSTFPPAATFQDPKTPSTASSQATSCFIPAMTARPTCPRTNTTTRCLPT